MNKNILSRCKKLLSFSAIKFVSVSLAAVLLFPLTNVSAEVVPLSVSGNKVLIGGQQGSVTGNSLFWSNNLWGGEKYYNASAIGWLKTDWNSKIVRAAMGVEDPGGYIADPVANKARVKAVVDAAIANDMYVIIDWHSHNAQLYQSQAIAFFQEMATTYGNKNNVIYEIYNEPLAVSWSSTIKPYANAVIAAIRAIDPDNLIVVGTPNWSQDVDVAALDPITGYSNIAYTLHFYAGSHGQSLRDKANTAMSRGIAIFVTEWGAVNADGGGGVANSETNAWLSYMQNNGISSANWSINDKAEGASALVPGASSTGGWVSSQLTASGSLVRSAILNWVSPNISNNPTPPVNLPVTVQAESYASMSGVQTETTTDTGGGLNAGWIDAGDWMNYSNTQINIPTTGTYKVTYRVASMNGGGSIALKKADGSVTYDTASVTSTGGWQNWVNLERSVSLTAGTHSFSITASTGGFNINWFKVETLTPSSSSSSAASSSAPAAPLVTIQAESYAAMNGVQTESTGDTGGGLNVGYIDAGDWMSYTNHSVTIPSTGTYTIEYRVASLNGGGSLRFEEAGGGTVYGTRTINATGGWQNWVTVKHTVTLTAGVHTFGINAVGGGWNFNWFRITPGAI